MTDQCEAKTTTGKRCKSKAKRYRIAENGLEYLTCTRHHKYFEPHPEAKGRNPNPKDWPGMNLTKKPTMDTKAALEFAEEKPKPKQKSGLVPEGDVRLTANIRADLHMKLKLEAAQRRTTIGDLIEDLVQRYL
jgi:hypothetical protein